MTVSAQTAIQWTSTSNTTFSVGSNWSGGVAPANDLTTNTALFNGTVTVNASITASRSIAGLDFQTAAGGWTLGSSLSSNTLTIGSSGINSSNTSGTNIISSALRLGANQTWTIGTGGTLRFTGASYNDNGYSANIMGAGTFDIRTAATATFSGQISTNALTFNNNANSTFTNSANSFSTLAIYSGRIKFSSIGNFGQASAAGTGGTSSTISIGANGGNAIFEYTGATATSNRSFTRDSRSTGSGIEVTTSGVTLTLTGAMSNTGAASANTTWNFGGAGNLAVNGVISNSGNFTNGITKTGEGTLTLGGSNTFTGNISIGAGTVEIGASGRLAAGSYAGDISNSGLFIYSGTNAQTLSGIISGAGGLTKNAASTLTLSGANTYTGTTTVNVGTIALGANQSLGAIAGAGNISLSSYNLTANSSSDTTFSGVMSGTGAFTKSGTGILTLSGANSYNGTTTMNAGQVNLNHATAIGAGTLTINGGSLDNTSGSSITLSNNNAQNWNGDFTFLGTNALNLGSGPVSMNATRSLTVSAGNLTVGGVVSGVGYGLTKTGAGTLTLTGANAYTGSTTISAGTLQIGAGGTSGALSTSSTIANNGVLLINRSNDVLQGTDFTSTAISGTGSFIQAGSGNTTLSAANTYAGSTRVNAGKLILDNNLAIQNSAFDTDGVGILELGTGITTPTLGGLFGNANFSPANFSAVTSVTLNTATGESFTLSGAIAEGASGMTLTKNGAGTQILAGNNTYTGATTINAGTLAIGQNGRLGGGSYSGAISNNGTFIHSGTNTQTLSGVISGTGALTRNGSNTLTLAANNTYTGATTINVGTLQLGNNGTSGALSISSAITNNGTLAFFRTNNATQGTDFSSSAISGTGSLVQKGSAVLTLNVANTYSGGTVLESGTIAIGHASALGNGTLTINGGRIGSIISNPSVTNAVVVGGDFSINGLGQAIQLSGTMDLGGATRTITVDGNSANLRGVISNGGLVKSGAANMFLYANNTYTGGTTITSGTLFLQSNGALHSSGSVSLSGGRFDITNMTAAITAIGSLSGIGGTVNLGNKTLVVGGDNSNTTFAGTIISNGSANAFTKNGSGTLTLTGNNTYNGTTTLNTGTIVIGHANAAGTGTITQTDGNSLLTFDTTGTIANAMSIFNVSANKTLTLSGGITVNNATFDVVSGETLTISNTINGTGGVTKNGSGTLVLSGNNTYSAPTVINSGTLEVANAGALGSNNTVQVNGGTLLVSTDDAINGKQITLNGTSTTVATLSFNSNYNGTIGRLTLSSNSIIDLGPANNIALAFADMVMGYYDAHNQYTLSIYNWSGTTKWGTTYGNGTDTIFFGNGPGSDYTASNVKFYSGAVGSNTFVGNGFEVMPETTWEPGLDGHYIIPVPEPETYATGLLLLLGGAWWMWRNRKSEACSHGTSLPCGDKEIKIK